MKIEESLTKENFWNEIEQKYPNAFKVFSDWLTRYFGAVNKVTYYYDVQDSEYYNCTFNDLPHAMQLGIWITFTNLTNNSHNPDLFFGLVLDIKEWMENYENQDSM